MNRGGLSAGEAPPEAGEGAAAAGAHRAARGEETTGPRAGGASLQRSTAEGADRPAGGHPSQGGAHLLFTSVRCYRTVVKMMKHFNFNLWDL